MRRVLLILLLSFGFVSEAVAESSEDIARRIYAPMLPALSTIVQLMIQRSLQEQSAEDKAQWDKLPPSLLPQNAMSPANLEIIMIKGVAKAYSKPQLQMMERVFATKGGSIIMGAVVQSLEEMRPFDQVLKENITGLDMQEFEREIKALGPEEEVLKVLDTYKGGAQLIKQYGLTYIGDNIINYYKKHKATQSEVDLCEYFMEKDNPIYFVPLCDAAYKAGYRAAGINVAKSYWQGNNLNRPRDIPQAKKILRKLLAKDESGAAHFYLAMLMKNAPEKKDKLQDAYCLLVKAQQLGFTMAAPSINEIADIDRPAKCR